VIHELFVETGGLPPGTYAAAAALQSRRELADYGPEDPDEPLPEFTGEDAARAIAAAEEFLRAIAALLGA
jgi:HEPN domain-containing protein